MASKLSQRSNPSVSASVPPIPGLQRRWWLLATLSILVAAYASAYVALGERVYPPQFAESFRARPWGIYPHAFFGMLALGLGPFQFRRSMLLGRPAIHRAIGRIYLVSAALMGLAGLYMSLYSYGGLWTHLGFGTLAIGVLTCATAAWTAIRRGDVASHRAWVTRSFALIFAAVTLRILLPILTMAAGAFEPAYVVVAWACWIPNLIVAETYLRRTRGLDPITLASARNA